jgi:hypothetical protein
MAKATGRAKARGPYKKEEPGEIFRPSLSSFKKFWIVFFRSIFRPTLEMKIALFGESATGFLRKFSYKKWSRAIPFAVEARSQMGLALILDPIVRL